MTAETITNPDTNGTKVPADVDKVEWVATIIKDKDGNIMLGNLQSEGYPTPASIEEIVNAMRSVQEDITVQKTAQAVVTMTMQAAQSMAKATGNETATKSGIVLPGAGTNVK